VDQFFLLFNNLEKEEALVFQIFFLKSTNGFHFVLLNLMPFRKTWDEQVPWFGEIW